LPKVLIAIPALNEQHTIGRVLEELVAFHPKEDIVVIDDGSKDETNQIALSAGVTTLIHVINLGVGGAMGTAFKYANLHSYEFVIQLDADGQHEPKYIQRLIEAGSEADVIIGSRFANGGVFESSPLRRSVMRLIGWIVSRYAKAKLTDVTSGFRLAGPRAIQLFALHYPYEYLGDTVESAILAAKVGLKVREVPVTMQMRAGGAPSQSVWRASLYTLRIFMIMGLAIFRGVPPETKSFLRTLGN
jgi:glycosyltransferase involved in cell wall biosynthesis